MYQYISSKLKFVKKILYDYNFYSYIEYPKIHMDK